MSEEKKDDLNEQQTFLGEHEELLKSIHHKNDTEEAETEETAELSASEADKEANAVNETETAEEGPAAEPPPPPPAPARKKAKRKAPRENHHSPQHEEVLRQQALEQSEVKEVLVFFRKYAKPAAIVIGVICVFVLIDRSLKARRYNKEAAADTALLEARTTEELQDIVDDYASTPSSPVAMMEPARKRFNNGQVEEAEELYRRFISKHSGHELALQAELNLITCKEARGQFGEAHLLYGRFAEDHAGSFLAPAAILGQARCLEALDQLDEAQIAYEDVIVKFPETTWSRIAEANLKTVLSKKQ